MKSMGFGVFSSENETRVNTFILVLYKGEETTINYLGVYKNHEARNKVLRAKLSFVYLYRLYFLSLKQRQENNRRLDKIYRLDNLISRDDIK